MKKITFLSLFLLTAQLAFSQAVAPYFQDFNGIVAGGDNSSIIANWTQYSYGAQTNDGDIWNGWSLNPGLAPNSNAYTLYHDDDETVTGAGVDNWFVLHLDCTSQNEVTFSYDEFQTFNTSYYDFHGVYTSEDYDVANGDAGTQPNGTWTLLREGFASGSPTNYSFTLPNTTTAIAFRYKGEWADNWFIDNISVGECALNTPASVSTPTLPLDDASDVTIFVDGADSLVNFQWPAAEEGYEVGSYNLNVSTSLAGFPNIGSVTIGDNSVNLIYNWQPNTTYYWSVDSSNCAGSAEGDIFSFTTGNTQNWPTVFERLQGNVYKQVETPDDCATCEEEINYYMFSAEGLRIIGTEYNGTCEQDDFTAFGDGPGEGEIVTNTTQEFEVCVNSILCQTVTFTSAAEDEIQFDFPITGNTWTAQLYEGTVPCMDTAGITDNEFNNVKMFPNPANSYLNFATNSNENIDIQIFDMLGKSILRIENAGNSVDISKLNSGIYFVHIVLGAKKSTKKLIIN